MLCKTGLAACDSVTLPYSTFPPGNLVTPCANLQPLPEGADRGQLLDASLTIIGQYHECATRHDELAAWATRALTRRTHPIQLM